MLRPTLRLLGVATVTAVAACSALLGDDFHLPSTAPGGGGSGGCDPLTSDGCPSGEECQVAHDTSGGAFTVCWAAGSKGQGEACSGRSDCAPTFACDTSQAVCSAYCSVGTSSCPAGTECTPFSDHPVIGGVEYGLCI